MMQLICSIVFSKLIYAGLIEDLLFGLFVIYLFDTDIHTNLKSVEHENNFLRPIAFVK